MNDLPRGQDASPAGRPCRGKFEGPRRPPAARPARRVHDPGSRSAASRRLLSGLRTQTSGLRAARKEADRGCRPRRRAAPAHA